MITLSRTSTVSTVELILFSVFAIATMSWAIVGNVFVIISVFTHKPLKNVPNILILSLAITDLAAASLAMPFSLVYVIKGQWIFGAIFCDIWLTFDMTCCTASVLNLCAIAIDRYYAIHDPIAHASRRTVKRVLVVVATVWVLSALISIPPLAGWNHTGNQTLYDATMARCALTDQPGYVIFSTVSTFIIPLLIMSFVYINIFLAIRRRLRHRTAAVLASRPVLANVDLKKDIHYLEPTGPSNSSDELGDSKCSIHLFYEEKLKISLSKERRAARTMLVIVAAFVLCWLPYFLMYVITSFCVHCRDLDPRIVNLIVWWCYFNSALNPIIYTLFNKDFRQAFKDIMHCKCNGCH